MTFKTRQTCGRKIAHVDESRSADDANKSAKLTILNNVAHIPFIVQNNEIFYHAAIDASHMPPAHNSHKESSLSPNDKCF